MGGDREQRVGDGGAVGAGLGSGGGTNPRPRSARNRRPSGAGGGARQGWGAAWRAPWERVTVGQGPVSAGPGSGAGGAWVQDAGGGSFLAQWDGCCRRRLLREWLCREGENEKETAYAASLR